MEEGEYCTINNAVLKSDIGHTQHADGIGSATVSTCAVKTTNAGSPCTYGFEVNL